MKKITQFEDYISITPEKKNGPLTIPVGVNRNGQLECIELSSAAHHHILISGYENSGKSNYLMGAIAKTMLENSYEDVEIWFSGGKYMENLFFFQSPSPHITKIDTDTNGTSIFEFIDSLYEEVMYRKGFLEKENSSYDLLCDESGCSPFPRLLTVIDLSVYQQIALTRYILGMDVERRIESPNYEEKVAFIMKYATDCGVHIALSIHDIIGDHRRIPNEEFWSAFDVRLSFYDTGKKRENLCMFGVKNMHRKVMRLNPGEAICNIPKIHKVKTLHLSYETKHTIFDRIVW